MLQPKRFWMAIAAIALFSAACGGSGTTTTPPASQPAGQPPASQPAGGGGGGDAAAKGLAAYQKAGCVSCHGDKAQGNVFPGAAKLAAWTRPCDDIVQQVRTPKDPSKGMPAFAASQVSDQDLADLCAWVKTQP